MSTQKFYLRGEDPSLAKEIDVPPQADEESLRHLVASHFAIVDPKGEYSC